MSINDIAYHLQNKVIRDATTAAKILHTQVDPGFMRGITWCERTPDGDYFPTYFGYLFAKDNVVICVEDYVATKGWDHIPWTKVFDNFDRAMLMVSSLIEDEEKRYIEDLSSFASFISHDIVTNKIEAASIGSVEYGVSTDGIELRGIPNVRHVVLFKENEEPVIVPLGDYDGDI